jgi:hypothetical protein
LRSGFKQETDCAKIWLTWQENFVFVASDVAKIKLAHCLQRIAGGALQLRVISHFSYAAVGQCDYPFVITPGFYGAFGFDHFAFILRVTQGK